MELCFSIGQKTALKTKAIVLKPTGFGLFPKMSPAVKRIALYRTALLYIASLSSGVLRSQHLLNSRILLSSHSHWIFLWIFFSPSVNVLLYTSPKKKKRWEGKLFALFLSLVLFVLFCWRSILESVISLGAF